MKQKFIEWFTKHNNGCSPAMEDDRSFVSEKTQHMFEAYQAGVAEGEARCAALAAENAGLKNAFGPGDAVLNFLTIALRHTTYDQIDLDDVTLAFRMSLPETPATDAYLSEVRAQGVEQLAKAWYAIANETDPGISISESSRLKYRQRADDAAEFANDIRQEATQ